MRHKEVYILTILFRIVLILCVCFNSNDTTVNIKKNMKFLISAKAEGRVESNIILR